MKRTQVQIPDALYCSAKQVAGRLEISLTELVRRGLEYIIAVSAPDRAEHVPWSLPSARKLGGSDPFIEPDWREQLHTRHACVAESRKPYGRGERGA